MARSYISQLQNVATVYIRLLNAKVTTTSMKKSIEENPDYPSLFSLSETLSKYNIENNAFEVTAEHLFQLSPPFVAYINVPNSGKDFVVVTAIEEGTVSYCYRSTKILKLDKPQFLKAFRDIVLIATPAAGSGEPDYEQRLRDENFQKFKRKLWLTGIIVLFLLSILSNISTLNYIPQIVAYSIVTLLNIGGLVVSILLLIYEIDKDNSLVKNICSAFSQSSCDAVLSSKASGIFGIKWGEIGFIYFACSTLLLLSPSIPLQTKFGCIGFLSIFAFPYVFFSVYYQWKVVKRWCPLCLFVQLVLTLELLWSTKLFWKSGFVTLEVNSHLVLTSLMILLLPILVWFGIKPILTKAKEHHFYFSGYNRIRNNPSLFNSLLVQQPQAADHWGELGIQIGHPNAPIKLLKVCNPYCTPCAKAHPELEKILHHRHDVQLRIIFTAKNIENSKAAIAVAHLLSIAEANDSAMTQQALTDWYQYGRENYGKFLQKYPLGGNNLALRNQSHKLEAMATWCEISNIRYTPTIYVNGFQLPDSYKINELTNLL